ncbi:MAG: hypothetical protein QNJ48_02310 [Desulfobacterales bacterium]|nr:hypothetical protein [Desulfobacterales bacterium]MDJ0874315.1 hypothetical protein [Desulfobacterales bacterium]MDJ0882960.1 hypothetical protein [Desulfobacterales bacterium]
MTVDFPIVVSNPAWLQPKPDAYRIPVREAYVAPAATVPNGMPIVHADTVSISEEARAAYRRLTAGES